MLNLFIDTNIFLNFYSFSDDHLNKLEKLANLINKSEIRLLFPQQVLDEFERNRESKFKETLEYIKRLDIKVDIPTTCHDISEMREIQKNIIKNRDLSKELNKKLLEAIKNRTLKADKLIDELFEVTTILPISSVLEKARMRVERGNPPGKKGELGDAINWECLLDNVKDKENLFFITTDKDYISNIDDNEFLTFLKNEWGRKKQSKIILYNTLSKFIKDKFLESKITEKEIKEEEKVALSSLREKLLKNQEEFRKMINPLSQFADVLKNINIPNVADIIPNVADIIPNVNLPQVYLPDINIPNVADIIPNIEIPKISIPEIIPSYVPPTMNGLKKTTFEEKKAGNKVVLKEELKEKEESENSQEDRKENQDD